MASLSFTISYKKNEGLVLSPSELVSLYLYGIKIQNRDGTEMSSDQIETFIRSAQEQLEHLLSISLSTKIIEEDISYYDQEFLHWAFLYTKYPVKKAFRLDGYLNTTRQVIEHTQKTILHVAVQHQKTSQELHTMSRMLIMTGSTCLSLTLLSRTSG